VPVGRAPEPTVQSAIVVGLTVVGLGPGRPELLTREAETLLATAEELWVRTRRHPTVAALPFGGTLRSFDSVYRRAERIEAVYEQIAERLVHLARRPRGVVYAVPGDPSVAERSVRLAVTAARAAGVPVRVLPGVSFVEPTLALLGADALADGLQVLDAADVVASFFGDGDHRNPFSARTRPFDATRPTLLAQIDSARLVSSLKLALLGWFPPEHELALVGAAGTGVEQVRRLPLRQLDRAKTDHLTSLFVPALQPLDDTAAFDGLRYVTMRLRAPGGCPWDREQTHASLRATLVEEAYEAVEAIDRGLESGDWDPLAEELGDLMMNVLLHVQIAAESGEFWLEDVLRGINDKLVRRHPHVFGDLELHDAEAVVANWDRIKRREKEGRADATRLGEVPRTLPALARAQTLERRAARTGFAWPAVDDVWAKLDEELAELRGARGESALRDELGDVLFMTACLASYLKIDAEEALRLATDKFARRFQAMEAAAAESGHDFAQLGVERQLALWEEVKRREAART
jgi:tetrapyrrole methylase family protein/MazG family protein